MATVYANSSQPGATYYPQAMPNVTHIYVPQQREPKYSYTPNDYMAFTFVTALVCGFFSPLTLIFTIPACIYSRNSQLMSNMGDIRLARDKGLVAAYLNIAAIISALVVAAVVIGAVIGAYGPTFYRQQCINLARSRGQITSSSFRC